MGNLFTTHIGKIVIDRHYLGAVKRPGGNEINSVKPGVLFRIRFYSAVSTLLKAEGNKISYQTDQGTLDLHNAILVLANNSAAGMLHIRPVTII